LRKYWVDYLRCLGILGVICTHVTADFYVKSFTIGGANWWTANVINASSRFAVPLFVMISGCVLLGRNFSIEEFYKTRFMRLFPPLIFWTLFYYVFRLYHGEGIKIIIRFPVSGSIYFHLWYLSMFICLMIFVPFINKLVIGKKLTNAEIAILAGIFVIFFNLNWLSFVLKIVKGTDFTWFKGFPLYVGYFMFGYYISRHISLLRMKYKIIAMAVIILSISGALLNYISYKYLNIIKEDFILYNLGPLTLIITSLIFAFFCKHENSLKENGFVIAVSDASFGIYLVHPFFLYYFVTTIPNYFDNGFYSIPITICGVFLISFFTIHVIRKNKMGRWIC
jgi:surface polysaccharide O-acyltransferase-like enzyme